MSRSLFLAALPLLLASCNMLRSAVDAIPVPNLSGVTKVLPTMKGIKKMLPDLSGEDSVGGEDQLQQFSPSRTLGFKDTLRISVYEGVRDAEEVYKGLLMVDQKGVVDFEDIGTARFGGRSAQEARSLTESVMRGAGWTSGKLHVHLISIENQPLIAVQGNVGRAGVYSFQPGMRASAVIAAAGGRGHSSTSRAVYITHKGNQRFFTSEAAADGEELSAGDIITVSGDL